eukprot:CAMPEP_0119344542 /NCGR_PEP_ID=MMETSP1333-20130426/107024_1 /TAXON_ID=418940 /ORGANISM="Scyphosphaera apsteinii, Strain RCC1455" /LENGTH=449 /DNA_ID=CAMNT_0007356981 /DNA_START=41 /DNA_END=1391 /DNA_ORIENTATION=-
MATYVKYDDRVDANGNVLYGFDKELEDKAKAKLSAYPKLEEDARGWIEEVLCEKLGAGSLQQQLKDGTVLCRLINTIRPNMIPKIFTSQMPFKQMENIAAWHGALPAHQHDSAQYDTEDLHLSDALQANGEHRGLPGRMQPVGRAYDDSFQTVALYENKDMLGVLTNIHSLGRVAQRVPGFAGPVLGAKLAEVHKRDFDEKQLQAAKAAPTFAVSGAAAPRQGGVTQARTVDTIVHNVGGKVGVPDPSLPPFLAAMYTPSAQDSAEMSDPNNSGPLIYSPPPPLIFCSDEKLAAGTAAAGETTAPPSATPTVTSDREARSSTPPLLRKPTSSHILRERSKMRGSQESLLACKEQEIEALRESMAQQAQASKEVVETLKAQVRELKEQNMALAHENSMLKLQHQAGEPQEDKTDENSMLRQPSQGRILRAKKDARKGDRKAHNLDQVAEM